MALFCSSVPVSCDREPAWTIPRLCLKSLHINYIVHFIWVSEACTLLSANNPTMQCVPFYRCGNDRCVTPQLRTQPWPLKLKQLNGTQPSFILLFAPFSYCDMSKWLLWKRQSCLCSGSTQFLTQLRFFSPVFEFQASVPLLSVCAANEPHVLHTVLSGKNLLS